jgi:putative hydrolase of the HAD superfamily
VTPKVLMVDVDGVVVRHPHGLRWDHDLERDLGVDPARLQSEFFAPHFEDVVLGRAGLHERLALVLADLAPGVSAEEFTAYWFARDAHLDRALLHDLAQVRARGVQLHLATVQEHLRARFLWEDLGLGERFDAIHYAADYGCKKPNPAFFQAVGERTGYAPHEMLLIDDGAPNVAAALAAGWDAVLWDGAQRLEAVLAGRLG